MKHITLTMPTFALLLSCTSQPDSTDAAPPVYVPECTADEDCSRGYICEEEVCEAGDRDNDYQSATPILLNQVTEGVLYPDGDKDYYSYESPAGKEWLLISTIGPEETEMDTVVTVYASNGALHHVMDDMGEWGIVTYDSRMLVYLPTPGTWYIGVEDASTYYEYDSLASDTSFEYTIELTEYSGTSDPDSVDDPSDEVDITSGTGIFQFGILLEEPGDSDWIEVTTPWADASLAVVSPTSHAGSDAEPAVHVYDAEGALVLTQEALEEFPAVLMRQEETTYSIEATDARGNGSDNHWYVVYVRSYDPGGFNDWFGGSYELEVEENDSFATANNPAQDEFQTSGGSDLLAAQVDGTLLEEGDEDWFEMTVLSDEYMSLFCWTSDYGSASDLAIDVVSPTEEVVEQLIYDDRTPPEKRNIQLPSGGDYRLRLYSPSGIYGPGAWYRCEFWTTDWELAE